MSHRPRRRADRAHRVAVRGAAVTRLAFAAWFAVRPDVPARAWGRPPSRGSRALAYGVAARELVLGIGTLVTDRRQGDVRPWVRAMAVADAVNGLATAGAGAAGAVPPRRAAGLALFDLAGTATELWLARRVRPRLRAVR